MWVKDLKNTFSIGMECINQGTRGQMVQSTLHNAQLNQDQISLMRSYFLMRKKPFGGMHIVIGHDIVFMVLLLFCQIMKQISISPTWWRRNSRIWYVNVGVPKVRILKFTLCCPNVLKISVIYDILNFIRNKSYLTHFELLQPASSLICNTYIYFWFPR